MSDTTANPQTATPSSQTYTRRLSYTLARYACKAGIFYTALLLISEHPTTLSARWNQLIIGLIVFIALAAAVRIRQIIPTAQAQA